MLIVRSGPPAKAGLGAWFGGSVVWGPSAFPYAVPSAVEVDVASMGTLGRMLMAKVEEGKKARAQVSMSVDLSILMFDLDMEI
jgi:hypothetical protein